jgi:hypothetical protein
MPTKTNPESQRGSTHVVSSEILKQVCDSPISVPDKYRWATKDEDVRTIEKALGLPERCIGALSASHHARSCGAAGTRIGLALFSPPLTKRPQRTLSIELILGEGWSRHDFGHSLNLAGLTGA